MNTAAPPRMPGLIWLRAAAALAVVALHAGIPYMTHSLPALEWCVRSTERSGVVDALCWAINIAVMPTFFLMGGALAHGVWKRNPGKAFLVHRSRRLIIPLLFAILVVLPADMYVWLIGWYTQDLIPWRKVLSIKLPSPLGEQFWGVAHLWYLECLWTLSITALLFQTARARLLPRRSSPAESTSNGAPEPSATLVQLLLVVTAGLLLALDPTFLIGFQQTWWPGLAAIAFYGLFFAAGWTQFSGKPATNRAADTTPAVIPLPSSRPLRAENRDLRSANTPRASRLLLAAALFALVLPHIHRHVETPFTGPNLFALTTAYAACSWLAATGCFSLARSIVGSAVPRPVTFTAEASFWMYLVHHPLVGLTQLALLHSSITPAGKFVLSLATAIGLSLATYALFVRGTWIGRLLDGRGLSRPDPRSESCQEAPATEEPARRAA